jgi:hypothetical protein
MQISVVGLDIAKQVFQVHATDTEGRPVAQVLDYFCALPLCLVVPRRNRDMCDRAPLGA